MILVSGVAGDDGMADKLQRAMLWILAFFVFALPLVEAPKNVAAVAYILVWAAYALRTRDFGGAWNRYDTAFALMLASGVASGLAGFAGDVGGVFRVYLVGWVISRSTLPRDAERLLPLSACAGVVIAILMAAVPMLTGEKTFLELRSVGQVNQSAMYIGIMAAAAFGWWLQCVQSGESPRMRTMLGVSATVCCAALLAAASRAATGGAAVAAVIIAAAVVGGGQNRIGRKVLVRAGATVAVLAVLVFAIGAMAPNLSDRKLTASGLFKAASTETRIKHWHLAIEGWRQRPWLGWGPESFQKLSVDEVCQWRNAHGEDCDRDLYMPQKHAHSLYAATLAERGLVGMAALLFLLAQWGWSLAASARTAARSWLWPASAAGLMIVMISGTFNTTLRVEHGSLAVALFGLWIAAHARRPREAS